MTAVAAPVTAATAISSHLLCLWQGATSRSVSGHRGRLRRRGHLLCSAHGPRCLADLRTFVSTCLRLPLGTPSRTFQELPKIPLRLGGQARFSRIRRPLDISCGHNICCLPCIRMRCGSGRGGAGAVRGLRAAALPELVPLLAQLLHEHAHAAGRLCQLDLKRQGPTVGLQQSLRWLGAQECLQHGHPIVWAASLPDLLKR
mmetsp:Transcript_75211/g.224231  ORF Transcript_75211/g.224231 Transcript_75211/m.224231 type:complete len:201 (-) Transcript_75211:454-1056(-)